MLCASSCNLLSSRMGLLSCRENLLITHLYYGLSAKTIAKITGKSHRTVQVQVANIKLKLGAKKLSPILLAALVELGGKAVGCPCDACMRTELDFPDFTRH